MIYIVDQWKKLIPKRKQAFKELSEYLAIRSIEICRDNDCYDQDDDFDEHKWDSYTYITIWGELLDICISDYFQGSSQKHVAYPLPHVHDDDGYNLFEYVYDNIGY